MSACPEELTAEIVARALHDRLGGTHSERLEAIERVIDIFELNGYPLDGWMLRNGDSEWSMHGDAFAKRVNEEIALVKKEREAAKAVQAPLFEVKTSIKGYGL